MKRAHSLIAGLILAAGIGGVAIAQPGMGKAGGCDGMGPMDKMGRHAGMKFDPAERAGKRLDYLKYQLKITPEQEPLWSTYAGKMTAEAGKGMQALRDPSDDKLSAPDRMAKMQSAMEERVAAMRGVHDSFNQLYAALTPEQKAIADKQVAQMGRGMMKSPDGRRGPGGSNGSGGAGRVMGPQG